MFWIKQNCTKNKGKKNRQVGEGEEETNCC